MPAIRPLSASLAKKAAVELNETPDRIESDLQAIREWLKKMPHIRARTDDQFLVAFLRGCKYSLEKVKEKLDMYYTVRTAIPELIANRDPLDPKTMAIIKLGTVLPLLELYEPDAPLVLVVRVGTYDPDKFTIYDVIATGVLTTDVLMQLDDNYTVAGQIIVFDMKNITMSHMVQMTPMVLKKLVLLIQEGVPIRQKNFHLINVPSTFMSIYNLGRSLVNDKLRKRIIMHKNLASLHEYIPKKIFPPEYDGETEPISALISEWERILCKQRKMLMDDVVKYGIDESKRPYKSKICNFNEIEGSFRKLTVD